MFLLVAGGPYEATSRLFKPIKERNVHMKQRLKRMPGVLIPYELSKNSLARSPKMFSNVNKRSPRLCESILTVPVKL